MAAGTPAKRMDVRLAGWRVFDPSDWPGTAVCSPAYSESGAPSDEVEVVRSSVQESVPHSPSTQA